MPGGAGGGGHPGQGEGIGDWPLAREVMVFLLVVGDWPGKCYLMHLTLGKLDLLTRLILAASLELGHWPVINWLPHW